MIERIRATTPYSGESEMLTPEEHKLYVEIKEAERDEDYKTMPTHYFYSKYLI